MNMTIETIRKANQKSIDQGKLNNPNYLNITKIVFREVGGQSYKLIEERNLQPEHNINGMFIIEGRIFSKVY